MELCTYHTGKQLLPVLHLGTKNTAEVLQALAQTLHARIHPHTHTLRAPTSPQTHKCTYAVAHAL